MAIWKNTLWHVCARDSRLGPIGGGTSEILKEIIAKMVIDNKDYKPAT